jgi:hypothetical protein
MKLKTKVLVATGVIMAHLSPFLPTAAAQYDGSFDAIYFNRTFSPKSEALGRSGVAVLDNAFSLQTNSSLVGHMSGYSLSYSYSNPIYGAEDGTFQFFGLTADVGRNMAIGLSEANVRFDETFLNRLRTVALIFKPIPSTAVSVDARNVSMKFSNPLSVGISQFDENQWYLNMNASYSGSYPIPIGHGARIVGGVRVENVFRNTLSIPNAEIELPQVATVGFSNTVTLFKRPDDAWANYVDVSLIAEYSDVLNSDYNTRLSAGTELDLSSYFKARVGYLYHTSNDLGFPAVNKDEIREVTYGFGAMLPISQLAGISRDIRLEIDYARMQHPLGTYRNFLNIGDFTMWSASLRVEL